MLYNTPDGNLCMVNSYTPNSFSSCPIYAGVSKICILPEGTGGYEQIGKLGRSLSIRSLLAMKRNGWEAVGLDGVGSDAQETINQWLQSPLRIFPKGDRMIEGFKRPMSLEEKAEFYHNWLLSN